MGDPSVVFDRLSARQRIQNILEMMRAEQENFAPEPPDLEDISCSIRETAPDLTLELAPGWTLAALLDAIDEHWLEHPVDSNDE